MNLLRTIVMFYVAGHRRHEEADPVTRTFPIILVPGIGGSRMEAKLNKTSTVNDYCEINTNGEWQTIWVNALDLLVGDCFVEDFSLVFDQDTGTTKNNAGVQTRTVDFGNTTSLEHLSSIPNLAEYFTDLVDHLVNEFGYERGVSIRGAPYDFRKAPNEQQVYFEDLKNLVEKTYRVNGNERVIILGHSLGGLITLFFLNHQPQEWKDTYIRSFVSVGVPYGGSADGLRRIISGYNFDQDIINAKAIRPVLRSMPSVAFMMPYDTFWNETEVLVIGPERNYTVRDYEAFYNDIEYPIGYKMRTIVEPLIKKLDSPGVVVHCVYGSGVNTTDSVVYHDWNDEPHTILGNGDGSVNIRSLKGCERWKAANSRLASSYGIQGASHLGSLSHDYFYAYLDRIIVE